MTAKGPGCVKTQAFNLRVENPSRFRQFKDEWRCGGGQEKGNRENNSSPCQLLSVFTQPRSKVALDAGDLDFWRRAGCGRRWRAPILDRAMTAPDLDLATWRPPQRAAGEPMRSRPCPRPGTLDQGRATLDQGERSRPYPRPATLDPVPSTRASYPRPGTPRRAHPRPSSGASTSTSNPLKSSPSICQVFAASRK
jgi:hypothetical protein